MLTAKRIANIVKDAAEAPLDAGALVEPAEKDPAAAFEGLRAKLDEDAAAGDYESCLRRIADLAPVLDRFFVDVMVMAEDPEVRRNRIALLQAIGRPSPAPPGSPRWSWTRPRRGRRWGRSCF